MKEKIKIEKGMRFGYLTIIGKAPKNKNDKDKHDKYRCLCDCGSSCIIRSSSLRKDESKSCGCLNREIKNISGQRFGRLTALNHVGKASNGYALWECQCDCGNKTTVRSGNLMSGGTRSCGCLGIESTKAANTTHGLKKTRLYRIWHGIKCRCLNPTDKAYPRYGGKGVSICNGWINDFKAFNDWAISNGYTDNLTIDRIDSNGNYEPSNCQWITLGDNAKRANSIFLTVNNTTDSVSEWSKVVGVSGAIIINRYKELGKHTVEEMLSESIANNDNSYLYKKKGYANRSK